MTFSDLRNYYIYDRLRIICNHFSTNFNALRDQILCSHNNQSMITFTSMSVKFILPYSHRRPTNKNL
jgi:hypothetical protein